jgi:hypothetical protein
MYTNALHTSHKTHYFSSTITLPLMLHREVIDFSFENSMKPATHWVAKVQDWYLLMDKDIFCKADSLKIRPSWIT